MIKVFEFLFYCLYRMFALVKRVGEKDENLASSFYSILLSTKSILLLSVVIRFSNYKVFFLEYPYSYGLKLFMGIIFIAWYFICKHYFIKKENYKRIIEYYENKLIDKNKLIAAIGILYFIFSFLFVIIIANS